MNDSLSAKPLVKLSNISYIIESKLILEKVSLDVNPASITTVIGPNGAGKSTLAKLIIGIMKPTSGEIFRQKQLNISYIPQKLSLDKNLPLDVLSFLEFLSQGRSSLDKIKALLEEVTLAVALTESVHSLSGGQFQKLMLAASLLNNPQLLVMDEATQGLDVNSQTNFYRIIERIKTERQCAVFMISHDLFTVMSRSEQVICLNKHICCNGSPYQIINNPEYIKIFGNREEMLSIYSHHHDHHH